MRAAWWWLGLMGCTDIAGTWQIDAVTIDGVTVEDAGFLDVQLGGATGSSTPVAYLLRYDWAPGDRAFVPDPTPDVLRSAMNTASYEDGGEVDLAVVVPVVDGEPVPVVFAVPPTKHRTLTLDAETPWGPMVWDLVR